MEWLLEQPELAVLGGQIQFTDETGQTPPMHLQDVRLVLRGSPWHHALRLDAQDDQGQQLHAAGRFRRPLLPSRTPIWQRWSGQYCSSRQPVCSPRRHPRRGSITVQAMAIAYPAMGDALMVSNEEQPW